MQEVTIPKISDLINGVDLPTHSNMDKLNLLLNQQPPEKWIKTHPKIANYKYLPIDKVEYLLKNKEFDYRLINCDKSTLDNFNKEFKKQYYKIYGTKDNN